MHQAAIKMKRNNLSNDIYIPKNLQPAVRLMGLFPVKIFYPGYRRYFFVIPSSCMTWVAVSSIDLPAEDTMGIWDFR